MANTTIFAWNAPPTTAELCAAHAQHLIIALPNKTLPDWSDNPILQAALSCVQFNGANVLENVLPNKTLWLMPEHALRRLSDYFGTREIHWQTEAVPQEQIAPEKLWFRQPEPIFSEVKTQVFDVIVIGAGIAGVATAYELARRGKRVAVLDAAAQAASAASGNRQGLLYAKISPHDTAQTELLLCGYGYTRRLLENVLPNQEVWGATGVLHINHDHAETQRNAALAQQFWHEHIYRGVSAAQATDLAGVSLEQGGLFWQQGVWLNPPALVAACLAQENIDFYANCRVDAAEFDGEYWRVHSTGGAFAGCHIVFCAGASSPNTPIVGEFPFQIIRGQTSLVAQSAYSGSLKTALSGSSYISPAWDGVHCFGATFLPNDGGDDWREADEFANQNELAQLNYQLYQSFEFSGSLKGHAAVRCDAHDHLPVVGALGQPEKMRQVYAKLALDKNYRLTAPCPYYPNAWVNTAHGSRGLATAPICAAYVAAMIAGEPVPLSQRLQNALHPNRLIIRQIIRGT